MRERKREVLKKGTSLFVKEEFLEEETSFQQEREKKKSVGGWALSLARKKKRKLYDGCVCAPKEEGSTPFYTS